MKLLCRSIPPDSDTVRASNAVAVDVADQRLRVQHLVAAQEIVAPERHRGELLLRPRHPAQRQRALGIEEIAVLPAGLGAHPLAGAIAKLAGDGPRRRGLEPDVEVDHAARRRRGTVAHLGQRHQPGRDQRAAQIVDLAALEPVARA